jgi:hypothetical protein
MEDGKWKNVKRNEIPFAGEDADGKLKEMNFEYRTSNEYRTYCEDKSRRSLFDIRCSTFDIEQVLVLPV